MVLQLSLPSQGHEMLIYVRNERGITVPIYIRPDAEIGSIWDELAVTPTVTDRTLRDKILVYNGKQLRNQDSIESAGIQFYSVVKLN